MGIGINLSKPTLTPIPTPTYIARSFAVSTPQPQSPKIEEETNMTPDEDKSSRSFSVRTKSGKISIVNEKQMINQAQTFGITRLTATAYVSHETKEYHTVKLYRVVELDVNEENGGEEEKVGKILRKYGVAVQRSIHNYKPTAALEVKEVGILQKFYEEDDLNGKCKREHGLLLNSVYGTLFITIFLGLLHNYSCQ